MEELIEKGKLAKSASRVLGSLSASVKNNALLAIADALEKNSEFIISENKKDIDAGRRNGMKESLIDRLSLNQARIIDMAEGIRKLLVCRILSVKLSQV